MNKAERIVDTLLEVIGRERLPPKPAFDDPEAELDFYTRNAFTAWSHALDRGPHPRLWQAVKGSIYEPEYREKFNVQEAGPRMNTLKKNRKSLTDEERALVMKRGAVWDRDAGKGKASPAVWKSVVNGKTYYVCNTHRAAQVKPTLKAAIRAFKYIKTTA
jgi:hypothetical protein